MIQDPCQASIVDQPPLPPVTVCQAKLEDVLRNAIVIAHPGTRAEDLLRRALQARDEGYVDDWAIEELARRLDQHRPRSDVRVYVELRCPS